MIQDGIAYNEHFVLADICRQKVFYIIIDESTDISVSHILALVVSCFDTCRVDIADALLKTSSVENGTAFELFTAVIDLLVKKSIPVGNVIGFRSDNCSTLYISIFIVQEHSQFPHERKCF